MQPWISERVVYEGRVQGIGFRFRTRERAQAHGVNGWVMNRDDGSVELVATGTPAQLADFLFDLERMMARFIIRVHRERLSNPLLFDDFSIRQ
jgi:acylphosphatase